MTDHGPEPVPATSADLLADTLDALRDLIPQAFTEGKVDFAKLRELLGDAVDERPERYSFTWAGKRDAIRLLQTPSRATLKPDRAQSVDFGTTQNLFIEGDNLEVLKLLYKAYFGRVKLIYIDPPYNTGGDFVYPDNYADPLDTYLELTGQKDGNGNRLTTNPETNGRYHSAWLSMMYPRLFLARQLLREDGVIFVSIDDHEVHNLRLVMNEVFGEENFVALLVAQTNPRGRTLDRFIAKTHEYVMVFARDVAAEAVQAVPKTEKALAEYDKEDAGGRYRELELRNRNPVFSRENRPNLFFPIYVSPSTGTVSLECRAPFTVEVYPLNSQGVEGCWTWGKTKVQANLHLLVSRQASTGAWRVFRKDYIPPEGATTKAKSIWLDSAMNHEHGKEEMGRLFGKTPFDFPKSVDLIRQCLLLGTDGEPDQLVLDFFAGSCTTAQAVLEANREDGGNRRFVMVQLPEPTTNPEFPTIAAIGRERIRRVIARLKEPAKGNGTPALPLDTRDTPEDLGFRAFALAPSNIRRREPLPEGAGPDALVGQLEMFADPLVEGWTADNVIYEVALKEGYALTCRIEELPPVNGHRVYRVTDDEKEQSFRICLDDSFDLETARDLNLGRDDLFICRNVALDDTLAANLALQCRLKTV